MSAGMAFLAGKKFTLGHAAKYPHFGFHLVHSRDTYVITATGPGMPTWEIELDALLVAELTPTGDPKMLLEVLSSLADSGVSEREAVELLQKTGNQLRAREALRRQQQAIAQQQLLQQNLSYSQQAMRQQQGQNVFGSPFQQNQLSGLGQQQGQQGLNQQALQNMAGGWGPTSAPPTSAPSALWNRPQKVETEILAYRGWMLHWELDPDAPQGPLLAVRPILHSINQECLWPGPVQRANGPIEPNGYTGLYAVGVEERFNVNFANYVATGMVWGEVSLSGLVVEGETGYRAEVCTIRRLWIGGTQRITLHIEFPLLAQLLADRYQCECGTERVAPTLGQAQEFHREAQRAEQMRPQPGEMMP